MPTSIESHQHRQIAESFGTNPERYDRARPRYPDALVDRLVAASPGTDVLDVGCGTGIAARQFQAAGCTVLGVEPDERMAAFARRGGVKGGELGVESRESGVGNRERRVESREAGIGNRERGIESRESGVEGGNRGLEVEVATFEAWDPAGRTFDMVIAAQSWHWVDPRAGTAKAARVLRPGGRLAIFAHVFEPPPPIADAFAVAFRRVAPDSPFTGGAGRRAVDIYQAGFDKVADGVRATDGFVEVEQWRFDWEQHYTRDEWLELLPTTGGLTRLPADKLADVLAAVGAAVGDDGFVMPFTTLAVVGTRSS